MIEHTTIETEYSLAGRNILVVEDEYFLADDIARTLKAAGATIVALLGDVEDAITFLHSGKPIDGAVLDINVRGAMIYPVADILRERNIPFVFATGYDQAALATPYKGITRLEKPFETSALSRALSVQA